MADPLIFPNSSWWLEQKIRVLTHAVRNQLKGLSIQVVEHQRARVLGKLFLGLHLRAQFCGGMKESCWIGGHDFWP